MDKNLAPIKQRVIQVADKKEDTRKVFYSKIGSSASNFRSDSLESEINSKILAKISSLYPDINCKWLLTGKGEMLQKEESESGISVEQYYKVLEENNKYLKEINAYYKEIIVLKEELEKQEKEIAQLTSENVALKKCSQDRKVG